jgi:hypothetical protein
MTLCVLWYTIDAKQLSHLYQCLNIHFNLLFVKAGVNVSGFLSVYIGVYPVWWIVFLR